MENRGRLRTILTISYDNMAEWDFNNRFAFVKRQLKIYDTPKATREINRVLAATGSGLRIDKSLYDYQLAKIREFKKQQHAA